MFLPLTLLFIMKHLLGQFFVSRSHFSFWIVGIDTFALRTDLRRSDG